MPNIRNKAIKILFSDKEFEKISSVSKASGVRPGQFVRMVALNAARKWKTLTDGKDEWGE